MTRRSGEFPEPEEVLLGIERLTPEQEAEAEKGRKEKVDLRQRFLIQLMQNPLFREWLMELLVGFRTFEKPFGVGPNGFPNNRATDYQDGLRAAGWHLWTAFDDVVPELASLMRREYQLPKP
jgi:hypothetical protein